MRDRKIDVFDEAVCKQHDPDIWHQDDTEEQAVRLCTVGAGGRPCPALTLCLDMSTDPSNHAFTKSGVWGGMTEGRRARLRAQRLRSETSRNTIVTCTTTNCQTDVQEFYL